LSFVLEKLFYHDIVSAIDHYQELTRQKLCEFIQDDKFENVRSKHGLIQGDNFEDLGKATNCLTIIH
jgi:hypothetical protein